MEWGHFIGGWRIKDLEKQRNNGVGPNRNSMGHCAQGNSACYAVGQKEKRKGGEKCDVWAGPRIKRCKRKG